MVDVPRTFGALLLGALFAFALSAVVTIQSFFYFKVYPTDFALNKIMVIAVWLLDLSHTIFICISIWDYLIIHFGDAESIDHIPTTVALTIAHTAALTLLVHCFFAHRIYKISRKKLWLVAPIVLLAIARAAAACVTTSEMIILKSLSEFVQDFRWVFTLGLGLSSTVDILIAVSLCYFLISGRMESTSSSLNLVIDSLILYTFETGSITCAATVVSMICWLIMPHNLIFMGLHFVISKLYANSLLASLNTRRHLSRERVSVVSLPAAINNQRFDSSGMFTPRSPGSYLSPRVEVQPLASRSYGVRRQTSKSGSEIEAQQIVSKPGSVLEAVLKGPQLPPSPVRTESLRSLKSEKSPRLEISIEKTVEYGNAY